MSRFKKMLLVAGLLAAGLFTVNTSAAKAGCYRGHVNYYRPVYSHYHRAPRYQPCYTPEYHCPPPVWYSPCGGYGW